MAVWLPGCSLLPTLATFISITQLSWHAPQLQEDIPNGAQPHSALLTKRSHSWIDLLLIKELSMKALWNGPKDHQVPCPWNFHGVCYGQCLCCYSVKNTRGVQGTDNLMAWTKNWQYFPESVAAVWVSLHC